jgi:hypothetical protein
MNQYGFSAVDHPRSDRLAEISALRSRAVAIQGLHRISANDGENIITEEAAADGLLPVSRALDLTGL